MVEETTKDDKVEAPPVSVGKEQEPNDEDDNNSNDTPKMGFKGKRNESFRAARNIVEGYELDDEDDYHPPKKVTSTGSASASRNAVAPSKARSERSLKSQSSSKKPRSIIGSSFQRSPGKNGKAVIRVIHDSVKFDGSPEKDGMPINADDEGEGEATWGDVGRACCIHSSSEWLQISVFLFLLLLLLYFFLVGLDLLGTAFKVVGGCTAGSMLSSDTNPLASVMIGIIATTLLQSSSTTTAIIVSLVSGGLDVQQGIYMIMGANVGTSVTCMLVSLAHMGDGDELERAFAGSSVLYLFNFLTLIILLPVEVTTQYLYHLTKAMLPASVGDGDSWEGPVKKMVSPLVSKIIIANKQLIDDISTGKVESCSAPGIYPVSCEGGEESYEACHGEGSVGVIACDKDSGDCPLFFQDGATMKDDSVSGWVCMVIALTILIMCLIGLVSLLRKMLLGASTQILYKATNINPYLAILIGCGVTILVQSSSITSSTLVPLAGVGVLDLEGMYPLVLGADIGTTFTALMAAMVSSKVEALQIALVHFFFNVTGGLIWYPIPFMRNVILRLAALMGKATRQWSGFPITFIVVMYFLMPLMLLGISSCFEQGSQGFTALGVFILLVIFGAIAYFLIWWYLRDGKAQCLAGIERRQRRAAAIQALADDMDYLKVDTEWCKNEIGRIKDYASHLQTPLRMEEGLQGLPMAVVNTPRGDDSTLATNDEDDRFSTFESCRSKPWKDILYWGAESIKGSTHL